MTRDLTNAPGPLKRGAIATLAAVALSVTAPAAPGRAAVNDFTCTGEQLGRWVLTQPTTFHRSASSPVSTTFAARPQVRRPGAAAPVAVATSCEMAFDLYHFGDGGTMKPIDGQYHLVFRCVATPEGGAGARGLDRRLSVPAPASGGPFDSPAMRGRLEETACQAARNAIFTATMMGR